MSEFPQIFTFYSFKGGVGRSMAVLNVAYALVAKGRHVLVLDMDLEAPGLSGFLRRHNEIGDFPRQDMVDLVRWAAEYSIASRQAAEPMAAASFPPLTDFIVSAPREKLEPLAHPYSELGRLDFVPVDEDRDYYGRLTALGMGNFQQDALVRVGSILHAWLKSRRFAIDVPDYYGPTAERTAAYDYVLVDSRTGVTETGGLCIGPLSDQLVVLTALNDQNVEGTRRFLEEVGILAKSSTPSGENNVGVEKAAPRLESKPTLIVASPVPAGEMENKRKRLQKLEAAVGKVVVKLSYHPQMALLESIFTRDCREEYLATEYNSLVGEVLRMANDNAMAMAKAFKASLSPVDLREAAHQIPRSLPNDPNVPFLVAFVCMGLDVEQFAEDIDFILWDRVCRLLSRSDNPTRHLVVKIWAKLLTRWSHLSAQPELAALRREAAMQCYEQVLSDADISPRERAAILFNRGVMYGELDDSDKAIADYTAVINMRDAATEHTVKALVNRGWCHFVAGRIREAIEDEQQAASLDPKSCTARGRLAIALLADGQTTEAMAACDSALVIASVEDLAKMTSDIQTAIERHGSLDGADEVLRRIEARRESLEH